MKKVFPTLYFGFFFTIFISTFSYGQFDPKRNCYCPVGVPASGVTNFQPNTNISIDYDGIRCNPNTFFAVLNSSILEFYLTGNTVSPPTTLLTGPVLGVAYCNNLDGGSFSPTIYSNEQLSNFQNYYNGTSWVYTSTTSVTYNPGGYKNYLYYEEGNPNGGPSQNILKYNGTGYTVIYSAMQNKFIDVADLAVDSLGNIWFTISSDLSNFISDSIDVVSPSGQLIAQYPFVFNCYHAYGSFILNNTFYIGLGSSNSVYPNSLIPVTIINNTPTIGIRVYMPNDNFYDLASCNVGSPIAGINDKPENKFNIFPIPLSSKSSIVFNREQMNSVLKIFDIIGVELSSTHFSGKDMIIEKGNLKSGVYIVQIIDNKNNIINRKLIVE